MHEYSSFFSPQTVLRKCLISSLHKGLAVAKLLGKYIKKTCPFYLKACALVRKRRAEETCDNAHDCFGYITLQHGVRVLPVTGVVAHLSKDRRDVSMTHGHWIGLPACGRRVTCCVFTSRCADWILCLFIVKYFVAYPTNVHQEVLKQLPHVVRCINLLHLHLCIHIAVVQEVDIGNLHLLDCWKLNECTGNQGSF